MQIDYWMWFDNSTIPLVDKINDGAMAFQRKFGQRPNGARYLIGGAIPDSAPGMVYEKI